MFTPDIIGWPDGLRKEVAGSSFWVIAGESAVDGTWTQTAKIWRRVVAENTQAIIRPNKRADTLHCTTTDVYYEPPGIIRGYSVPGERMVREVVIDNQHDPVVLLHHSPGVSPQLRALLGHLPAKQFEKAIRLVTQQYPMASILSGVYAELKIGDLRFLDNARAQYDFIPDGYEFKPRASWKEGKQCWEIAKEVKLALGTRLSIISGITYRIPNIDMDEGAQREATQLDAARRFVQLASGNINKRFFGDYFRATMRFQLMTPYKSFEG